MGLPDDPLILWTIYINPADYPGQFVARKYRWDQPMETVLFANTLADIRAQLPDGLTCLRREDQDDPSVVETWL